MQCTAVLQATETIEQIKRTDFFDNLSQKRLDNVRAKNRDLIKYLEASSISPIYSNIIDSDVTTETREVASSAYDNMMYKKRVERFIRENKTHLTISKIQTNQIITTNELEVLENILFDGNERGIRIDFEKEYGEEPLSKFIRSILGLDIETAHQAFADFIQTGNLEADQMTLLNKIITYLTQNGTIDKKIFFESPFTDVHDQGLLEVFDNDAAGKIVSIIDEINENVEVG